MARSVLVAYASKYGSTQEVAEAIAETLREQDLSVEVRPAGEVKHLDGHDAVVLGGAIYLGHLHQDARRFLARHRQALAELPVAVFAMGPRTLADEEVAESRHQLDHDLAKFADLEPVALAIFGGVVDPAKLRFPFSRMPASDARDWDAIRAWAEEVASAFAPSLASGQLR